MANSGDVLVTLLTGALALLVLKPEKLTSFCGIEGFGNYRADGSMAPLTASGTTGKILFGNSREHFDAYRQQVNASIPTKAQLERISNLKTQGGHLDAFVPPEDGGFASIDYGDKIDSPMSPCSPALPTFDSASLLPSSQASGMEGFQFNEEQAGLLASQSWLTASERIGIHTNSGLRNSSQDLRGDPFIIKMESVSPWNNSTFYPDLTRRPLSGVTKLDPSYKQTFKENLGMFT